MLHPTASRTLTARSSVPSASRLGGLCLCASVPLCPLVTRVLTFAFIGPIIFAQHLKSTHNFSVLSAWDPNIFKAVHKILNRENAALGFRFLT